MFVEGGGRGDSSLIECRRAFSLLFERAGLKGRMPQVIACGPRQRAFDMFEQACKDNHRDSLLLVDSECAVTHTSPGEHVRSRRGDGWSKPAGATDDDLHLMVECMEAWIVADRQVLRAHYGQLLQENALPSRENIEEVPKAELHGALERATRQAGGYSKGKDSFALLGAVDPGALRTCPWAWRFFAELARRSPAAPARR